jgi:membrane protease YdiL (CAAX protease family)
VTASEIFGDATEALGRHPAAASMLPRSPVAPPPAAPESPAPEQKSGIAAWVTWTPGIAFAGILAALLGAIVLSIPVAIADPNIGTADASVAANTIAQLIQTVALIGVPLAIALRGSGRRAIGDALASLGLRPFKPSAFGWMGAAVLAYLVIATLSYVVIKPHQDDIAGDFGPLPLQILMIAILAPLSEELSFRGFLFGGLRSRLPALASALISGALFGALHAPGGIGVVPQLIAFGAILALLYEKTGSIVPGLMLHVLNNTVGLIAN